MSIYVLQFWDQILKSTETGTEYRYRRYFFQKVSNIVPSVLFWKSICTVIVGSAKVLSAHLCTYQCTIIAPLTTTLSQNTRNVEEISVLNFV